MQFLLESVACNLPEYRGYLVIQSHHHDRQSELIISLSDYLLENKIFHKVLATSAVDMGVPKFREFWVPLISSLLIRDQVREQVSGHH